MSTYNPYEPPAEPLIHAGRVVLASVDSLKPAPRWRRFVAFFVDATLVGVSWFFVLFVLSGIVIEGFGPASDLPIQARLRLADLLALFVTLIWSLGLVGYSTVLDGPRGRATLGKRLTGIVVVGIDGRSIGLGRSFARTCLKGALVMFYGLPMLWMFFNRRRQALHDRIVDTMVVLEADLGRRDVDGPAFVVEQRSETG